MLAGHECRDAASSENCPATLVMVDWTVTGAESDATEKLH